MSSPDSIHDFDRPPLNEVVVGVQFANANFSLVDAGLFAASVGDEFPLRQVAPPMVTTLETFEEPFSVVRDDLVAAAMASAGPAFGRAWFHSNDGTRLLQIQGDRLLVNWRARPEATAYPRYGAVRAMFGRAYSRLAKFAETQSIGELLPIQAEVSYFNRIYPPSSKFGQASSVFRHLSEAAFPMPGEPETVAFQLTRRLLSPDQSPIGRMHIRMSPAFAPDSGFFFMLELTVRGSPAGATLDAVQAFHDICREAIVRSFTAMTTSEMHAVWGLNE